MPEACGSRVTARHLARLVAGTGAHRIAFGSGAVLLHLRIGLRRVPPVGPEEPDRAHFPQGTTDALPTGSRP